MIYLVEDDDNIRELVVYTLNSTGMEAEGFSSPAPFQSALGRRLPELILLDIMLPETDGLTLLRQLKQGARTSHIPVIMLTAKGSEIDKVRGFESGADDYIAKPFGMMELVARVKARMRPAKPASAQPQAEAPDYRVGDLHLCSSRHEVTVCGEPITLTLKEFDMLAYLLENRGLVLTRDQILNRIWGYAFDGESRTVDVHIRTLRSKLGPCCDLVETVRGVGYKIAGDGK